MSGHPPLEDNTVEAEAGPRQEDAHLNPLFFPVHRGQASKEYYKIRVGMHEVVFQNWIHTFKYTVVLSSKSIEEKPQHVVVIFLGRWSIKSHI